MKSTHKASTMLLTAVVALSLVACSTPSTGSGSGPTDDTAVATPEEITALGIGNPTPELCEGRDPITVGYDVFSDTQDYVVSLNKSLKEVNEQIGGCVEFVMLVDNIDPATAVANIKTFIQREVDAVLLFQVVSSAQPGIMKLLNDAGIPVVAHAVPAPGAPLLTSSDVVAGETSANGLIDAAEKKFPGVTPFVILGNAPVSGAQSELRVDHQAEIFKAAYPDLTDDQIVFLDTAGKPDVAFARTNDVLSKVPTDRPILVGGINDDAVGGIFRALDQGGKSANVFAAGMGALFPSGVQNVCDFPQFVGTVDFEPDRLGNYLVPALLAVTDGVRLPEVIDTPISLLTKEAVATRFPGFEC